MCQGREDTGGKGQLSEVVFFLCIRSSHPNNKLTQKCDIVVPHMCVLVKQGPRALWSACLASLIPGWCCLVYLFNTLRGEVNSSLSSLSATSCLSVCLSRIYIKYNLETSSSSSG